MATLTPTLTLVSTDAFSHQPINVSVTDSLSVVAPYTDLSRIAAATSGGTELIAATQAVVTYIFLKHTGVLASNGDRKSTRLNSSHSQQSRMPSSA